MGKTKLAVFTHEMILSPENPKEFIKKKKTIRANKWVQHGCRIQDQYAKINFYNTGMNHQKIKLRKQFQTASKRIKYLGTNLMKQVQEMHWKLQNVTKDLKKT